MNKKVILASVLALFLTACETTKTRVLPVVEFQKIEISSQFLDCDEKKIVYPDPKKLTVKQLNQLIIRLVVIVEECQTDTTSVKKVIAEYNQEVDRINERSKNEIQ